MCSITYEKKPIISTLKACEDEKNYIPVLSYRYSSTSNLLHKDSMRSGTASIHKIKVNIT